MYQKNDQSVLDFELGDYLVRRSETTDEKIIQAIDLEVWERFGECWAIMYTDLSGFSKNVYRNGLMYTLGVIHTFRSIAMPIIELNNGLLVKTEGDSLMLLFKEVEDAFSAAIQIMKALHTFNSEHQDPHIYNACGIGYGRILKLGNYDIYGLEVNLASKLGEDIGKGSEILLTQAAKEQLEKTHPIQCEVVTLDATLEIQAFRLIISE